MIWKKFRSGRGLIVVPHWSLWSKKRSSRLCIKCLGRDSKEAPCS